MLTDTLDVLHERYVRLMLERPTSLLSQADQHNIRKKFANKSLQELQAMVKNLEKEPV